MPDVSEQTLKKMGTATGLIVSWSCYRHNYWIYSKCLESWFLTCTYAGSIPHNQTCVMEKMSTDPVAIMAGMSVWYKYNRHAHWSNDWVPSIPVSRVLVRCNKRTCLHPLRLGNRHICVLFHYHIISIRDGKDVWCDGLVVIHGGEILTDIPADLVPSNQICNLVRWKSKRKATRSIPLHQTCQLKLWNFSW